MRDRRLEIAQALETGAKPSRETFRADFREQDIAATRSVVPLLLSTNSLFLQHAAVCLISLLVNNLDLFFDIVIVSRPAEDLDEKKLRRTLKSFANYSLRLVQFAPPENRLLPLNAHYTLDTWTRLWVEEFFPAEIDRVLYLDVDIVVVGGIASLWSTDLGGALLGAVDIPGAERVVQIPGMSPAHGYFNAGVMLIDLKQWRETRALDTVLDYVSMYPGHIQTVDQDALNACFNGRKRRLEYKWNVIRPFFRDPSELPLTSDELAEIRRDARIIHFNGGLKPWSYFSDHPRKGEYQKYLRMTEWRDYVPPDRTPINRIRKGISAITPGPVKGFLKTLGSRVLATRA